MRREDERRRSPAADKELDFEHQRRGFGEYPHASRHGKRKRRMRTLRRRGRVAAHRELLRARTHAPDYEALQESVVRATEGTHHWNWPRQHSYSPLGDWVVRQVRQRMVRHGWGEELRSYDSAEHRASTERWLRGVLRTRGPYATALALVVGPWLRDDASQQGAFLSAFFQEQPIWRTLLLRWLSAHTPHPRRWR